MLPIGIQMAVSIGAPLYLTIGAVVSGGIMGDHCSPISDTTILSSMASASDHIDHVNTQLPYALLNGAIATGLYLIFGFIM
jgi:Na+/H+ antiporter NhaC